MIHINKVKFNKHYMFETGCAMQDFLRPLTVFGITHFTLIIMRKNKAAKETIEFMSSDPRIFQPYIDEQYYRSFQGGGLDQFIECNVLARTYVQSDSVTGEFAAIQNNQLNIAHGIDMIKKFEDRCEIYYFASTPNNSAIENFYLNNIDLLDSFIMAFREKAKTLLHESFQSRICCPDGGDNTVLTSSQWRDCYLKKYQLTRPKFTAREEGCARYIRQGLKTKEVAKKLAISPRTVEKYLATLRVKTNSKNFNQLIVNLNKYDV